MAEDGGDKQPGPNPLRLDAGVTSRREAAAARAELKPTTPPGVDPSDPTRYDNADPVTLPRYQDPEGRRIMPRHRREALRQANAMGLEIVDGNHAMHVIAARGIDIFGARKEETMLSLAEKSSSPPTPALQRGAMDLMHDPDEMNIMTDARQARQVNKMSGQEIGDDAATEREMAIASIQRELVARRRRRFTALLLRVMVFVLIPTVVVGYYFNAIATDMYATDSEFVIQTSENPGASGGLGGLLSGTGFATSQDSIVVQGYLTSREAFLRLEEDFGYMAHFQDPAIDQIQRLQADATLDDGYAYYTDNVTIGYDPTEGILRMTVVAATPQASQAFAEALVGYAEERVDGLSAEARGGQLRVAEERYLEAEQAMLDAERRVVELQSDSGVLSAEVELSSQMGIINSLELELENKRLALAELQDNAVPNRSRTEAAERDIERLAASIAARRADLTNSGIDNASLAAIGGDLRIAQAALATRHLILQESIAAMEAARLEASRQVRYLSLAVAPTAPVDPTYPRKVQGTIMAFLVFSGIYILVSLTASILREQVSV